MYPSMSVYENIAFPLRVLKQNKADIDRQVKEAANLVGVGELLQRSIRQVSGGEAQRVALARAMVRRPDVFLMDEPLSSLDAKLRIQLRTEIKRLHQTTNSTIIFVTHDQEEAMVLGDVIVVMDRGNVQQVGTPQDVFFKPRNIFAATFVGTPTMNLFSGTIRQNGDGTPCVEMEGFVQPVPGSLLAAVKSRSIEQVKWGIRPEAVKLISAGSAPTPGDLPGEIELIEAMGSRQLAYVRAANRLFAVIEDGQRPLKGGDKCSLHFDESDTHLFDATSGASLAQGG
jgi:multiple sugar transport system ATP-binding protein